MNSSSTALRHSFEDSGITSTEDSDNADHVPGLPCGQVPANGVNEPPSVLLDFLYPTEGWLWRAEEHLAPRDFTDREVKALLFEDVEDRDGLMSDIQDRLRNGDTAIMRDLIFGFQGNNHSVDARCLALGTLAGARAQIAKTQLPGLVREALRSPDWLLQFSGLSAASYMTQLDRLSIRPMVEALAKSASGDLRDAAENFLRWGY